MRIRPFGIATMTMFLLTACPAPQTELSRTADMPGAPDMYCLIEELRKTVDGHAVTYTVEDLPPGTAHSVSYLLSGVYYGWWFLVRKDASVTVMHRAGLEDSRAEELPQARERMRVTEAAIRNRCGMGTVMDSAQESCRGKGCRVR